MTQTSLAPPPSPQPLSHGPFRLLPNTRAQAAERRRLHRDLRRAAEAQAFTLQFQPRLCLTSGLVQGVEAVLLWQHRAHGQIAAPTLLAMAEQEGCAASITTWHLAQSLTTVTADPDPWPHHWTVSVHISANQLTEGILLRQIAEALECTGLAPERLEIGIGEDLLADLDIDALLTLSAIRDLGVGLALDDFGTGFASLSMLKRVPLTVMKLDRSLIRGIPADREDSAIVRAVISAGHAMGLDIVADGVDSEPQRAFLSASGCQTGQGALFSPLLTRAQLGGWIAMS